MKEWVSIAEGTVGAEVVRQLHSNQNALAGAAVALMGISAIAESMIEAGVHGEEFSTKLLAVVAGMANAVAADRVTIKPNGRLQPRAKRAKRA